MSRLLLARVITATARLNSVSVIRFPAQSSGQARHDDGRRDRILRSLSGSDLLRTFRIQGYTVTGREAVYQVVSISACITDRSCVTNQLLEHDLGFYRELDQTGRVPDA